MQFSMCTPRCVNNEGSPLPGNNPAPAPGTGQGLPDGGEPGQLLVNIAPGEGEWQDAPEGNGLPPGGTPGQVIVNIGDGEGEWGDPVGEQGKSAYEVAVDNGFSGTEEEWLESLVGPEGPAGEQGLPGDMGLPGPAGSQGPQGVAGPEGPEGDVGLQGPQGPQGVAGPQGMSLTIDEYGDLNEAKITAIEVAAVEWWFLVNPNGDDRVNQLLPAGIQGDMERHLIVYQPAPVNAWQDFGQFTGIQGPQGPAGPQGVAGPQGAPGPQGIQGVVGPAGPAGATGATGAAGISAYQVALNNGFVGTQSQWLASLVGPQGPQGIQGIQGPAGATGATGPAGTPGTNGTNGTNGTTQPSYDVTLYNDTVVPAGIYPLTIYQPIAFTYTKFTNRTAQGTITTVRILKNGAVAATISGINTTLTQDVVNIPTVVGDILEIELITVSGVRRADFTLT